MTSTRAGSRRTGRILVVGRVITDNAVLDDGGVLLDGERVLAVGSARELSDGPGSGADALVAPPGGYVLPGLVDLHNHGGGGASFPDATDAATALCAIREHRRHGTTSLVASLITAPPAVLEARLDLLAELCENGELVGIHLEGPFLSGVRRGAQNSDEMRLPDAGLVRRFLTVGRGYVVAMTLAPELAGADAVVDELISGGALPSFGHTDAEDQETRAALDRAYAALARHSAARSSRPTATHLYNGMRPTHHRDPGPVPELIAAAAGGRAVLELIADGVHVAPALVRAVAETVGRENVVLVTDAMAAAGMTDGEYRLGDQEVSVEDGVARLRTTGSLAGGTAHLIDVVRTTVAAGISLVDAVYMASAGPAAVLGTPSLGRLAIGAMADVVITDADLRPLHVLHRGRSEQL